MNDAPADRVLAHGRFLRLIDRDGWEFAERCTGSAIVAVLALTDDDDVVLVEQFRPPLAARTIELPAGIAGDIAGQEHESLETAAARELEEETGYRASALTPLFHAASSGGLTSETVHFFRADRVQRVGDGGGDQHEDIEVHLVARSQIMAWLQQQDAAGKPVDAKVYAAMAFLDA